jgi:hypothetical protein
MIGFENKQSMEMNQMISIKDKSDLLTNHTLEDEFVKVQIGTNKSSTTFGTVLSIQMKFPN